MLDLAEPGPWNEVVNGMMAGNTPGTVNRFVTALTPFMGWLVAEKYLPSLVTLARHKDGGPKKHVKRRQVAELRPDLLVYFFSFAAIHLRAQLYVEWSTAGRVSSLLFGCKLADLILTPDRPSITFHDTKNGDTVTAALHPEILPVLEAYLKWRGGLHRRNEPLFLTHRRQPYSIKGHLKGAGGQNKTAFHAARSRAVKAKIWESVMARRAGDVEQAIALKADARLLNQVTQHWLRHWFVTHSLAGGMSLTGVMGQGGFRSIGAVQRYQHDVDTVRRAAVAALPISSGAVIKK